LFSKLDRIDDHKLVLEKTPLNFAPPGWLKMGRFLMT